MSTQADHECKVKLALWRDGWQCSQGTRGCIVQAPKEATTTDETDCPTCDGEGVLAEDIDAHERETGCELRHDITDDDGAVCHCGVTLPPCPGCEDYSQGRRPPSLIEQVAKVAEPPLTRAYLDRVTAEAARLREGLTLIANGHLSPCMGYAQRLLDGEQPREALTAEIARRRS